MLKKISFFVLMYVFIIFTVLIFGEILVRVLRGGPDNPLALVVQEDGGRYLCKPDTSTINKSSIAGEFEYAVNINSHGYRGKEFLKNKPDGVTRIMAIGDSFTFGVGSSDDESFAALIENGLIDQGADVEVINAGVGHASTVRHWDNLQKIHLQYKPDVVVLFFDLTDLWDDWHWERHAVWDKHGESIKRFDLDYYWGKRDWWMTMVHRSALAKYIQNKVVRTYGKLKVLGWKRYLSAVLKGQRAKSIIAQMDQGLSEDDLIEHDGLLMLRGRERQELIDKHWMRTTKYLTKIRNLLKEKNIPLMIVMYPHGIYVGPDQWNEGRRTWGFEQGKQYTDFYPFELMAEFCKKEDIPFVNTLPAFLKAPKDQYFFNWDGHMTSKGNHIVAEQLLNNHEFLNLIER